MAMHAYPLLIWSIIRIQRAVNEKLRLVLGGSTMDG